MYLNVLLSTTTVQYTMSHLAKFRFVANFFIIVQLVCFCSCYVVPSDKMNDYMTDNDPYITPYNVREEGCPVVSERDKLNLSMLSGTWTLPYASLNWLADIGMSLYNQSVKMSQITSICPRIVITNTPSEENNYASWSLKFVCPKLKGEFEMWCWYQNAKTKSKFLCWNDRGARDMYLMIAATDHMNWIVLLRCSPNEDGKPAEGMSWALLSKTVEIESDISDVLFGLLEGYGFDVEEFKSQLFYDSCQEPEQLIENKYRENK